MYDNLFDDEFFSKLNKLKDNLNFTEARNLISDAHQQYPNDTRITQECALCTYKDEELPPHSRFNDALSLLESIGLRDPMAAIARGIDSDSIPETLGLGGAIYKRKWEFCGLMDHLQQSLIFYRAAWEYDHNLDKGWSGINAAYILDILASRASLLAVRGGIDPEKADDVVELQSKAKSLRQKILTFLNEYGNKKPDRKEKYWYLVTMAELYFGLEDYIKAGEFLKLASKESSEWKLQTTFKQLVSIARLRGYLPPKESEPVETWEAPWQALHQFLGDETEMALSCHRGKVGLALSGGGLRASIFHMGVLARLAEMDVLRYVEAMSTVSGGSVIGAHYYLEVQKLIEDNPDMDIKKEDYINLIKDRLIPRFLKGIQKNLRTKTLANLIANIKMIYSKAYSRSHRVGELFESELYSNIGNNTCTDIRTMDELLVKPNKVNPTQTKFNPKSHNWRRRAKVPVLMINATSLNSGHSWQFTGRWMGEPPAAIGAAIDMNQRYNRVWYEDISNNKYKNYRLGYAVAASACVPGLLEPLALDELYPEHTIRLVDGGVHDNQGVQGLMEQGCTLVLCSDASGQMDDELDPPNGIIGVPLRSNSILMDRIRESQYQELSAKVESQSLQGLFFIHMKKELATDPLAWEKSDQNDSSGNEDEDRITSYNIDKNLQRKIASIRTDLDSFTEVEAYSLMLSGYLMTEAQFKQLDEQHKKDKHKGSWGNFDINAQRGEWDFLVLEDLAKKPESSDDACRQDLGKQISVSAKLFFKIWHLSKGLKITAYTLLAILATSYLLWVIPNWSDPINFGKSDPINFGKVGEISFGTLTLIILAIIVGKAIQSYIRKSLIAFFGFFALNIHLLIFDKMYIKRGKISRLLKLKK